MPVYPDMLFLELLPQNVKFVPFIFICLLYRFDIFGIVLFNKRHLHDTLPNLTEKNTKP